MDEIDDIVSIGDCQSETVGLALSYVPDGWQCRACELLQACDQAQPLDLGSNFNVEFVELAGIPIVYGTHASVDAELAITTSSALSDDDITFLTMILDGVVTL